jgi:hypothetical protein
VDLIETGLPVEVFSTIRKRLSSYGSMRKINSELSPWRKELILVLFSPDLLKELLPLKKLPSLLKTHILVTLLHAQLI